MHFQFAKFLKRMMALTKFAKFLKRMMALTLEASFGHEPMISASLARFCQL